MLRIFLALCFLLSSCQKASLPKELKTVRINICTDPPTLDPRKARDLTTTTLMHMLFEGLTRTDRQGEWELALADEVQVSEDGLQYVFHLRKSFWSNGDPVTSSDFAYAWKTILDPSFPSDIAYQLYVLKNGQKAKAGEVSIEQIGVQAPDPRTLVIQLEQPIPYFLKLLSLSAFLPVPQKVASKEPNWDLQPKTHVGNGPFSLESWTYSDQLRVIKNPQYWDAKSISLEGIDLLMLTSDTEIRMFEENKIDWAGSPLSTIPVDAIQHFVQAEKLQISPFSGTYFFRVNTEEKIKGQKNPLFHPEFRKALALSLDRAALTTHILQGGQTPAKSLVPPEMGLSENGYFADNHREEAHALLYDALMDLDLTLDNLPPLTLSYYNGERNAAIAQAVQKQWQQALGIEVELEAVEPKIYQQRISKSEFQLAQGSWTADFDDPINFLEVFKYKEASTNHTQWENAKYIDLLNRSVLCRDVEERRRLLQEAEQILMDQMPVIPVFHFALNYLKQETLKGVTVSPLGQVDFRWAQWETTAR